MAWLNKKADSYTLKLENVQLSGGSEIVLKPRELPEAVGDLINKDDKKKQKSEDKEDKKKKKASFTIISESTPLSQKIKRSLERFHEEYPDMWNILNGIFQEEIGAEGNIELTAEMEIEAMEPSPSGSPAKPYSDYNKLDAPTPESENPGLSSEIQDQYFSDLDDTAQK